jgi:hypothetical protein
MNDILAPRDYLSSSGGPTVAFYLSALGSGKMVGPRVFKKSGRTEFGAFSLSERRWPSRFAVRSGRDRDLLLFCLVRAASSSIVETPYGEVFTTISAFRLLRILRVWLIMQQQPSPPSSRSSFFRCSNFSTTFSHTKSRLWDEEMTLPDHKPKPSPKNHGI